MTKEKKYCEARWNQKIHCCILYQTCMCLHVSLRFNYFPKFKCLAAVDLDDFDNKWTTFIILVVLAGWPCRSCSRKTQMSHSWPVLIWLQIKVWQRTFKTNRTSQHKYKPPGNINQIRYCIFICGAHGERWLCSILLLYSFYSADYLKLGVFSMSPSLF